MKSKFLLLLNSDATEPTGANSEATQTTDKPADQTETHESSAETENDEAGGAAVDVVALKETLPPKDDAPAVAAPAKQPARPGPIKRAVSAAKDLLSKARNHGKTGMRRGAPCRSGNCGRCRKCVQAGSFGAPAEVPIEQTPARAESQQPTVPEIKAGAGAGAVADSPSAASGSWEYYGKAGASLVHGVYAIRTEKRKPEFQKKLPPPVLDRCMDRLRVPEDILRDLRDGYAGLAQHAGLPAGGGALGLVVSAHINLELHYRAGVEAILSEIRNLPDYKPPGASQQQPASHVTDDHHSSAARE